MKPLSITGSNLLFQSLFLHHPDGVFALDDQGAFVNGNHNLELLFGFGTRELMGTPLRTFIFSHDQQRYDGFLSKALKGESFNVSLSIRKKDGFLADLIITMSPIYTNDEVTGIYGFAKEQETSLENESMFDYAQQMANLGSWELNLMSHQVIWSKEVYRILGIIPGSRELNLDTIERMIHPDDKDLVRNHLHDAIHDGKSYDFQHRIVRMDGSIRTVHEKGSLIYNASGDPVRFVGTVHDLTDRIEKDRHIAESRQKYESLFMNMPDAMFKISRDGRFLNVNPALEKIIGYCKEELFQMSSFLELIAIEDIHAMQEKFQQVLQGSTQEFEATFRHKDGRSLEAKGTAVPMLIDGQIQGVTGMAKDMTEENRLTRELEESNKRMETLITAMPDFVCFKDGEGRWLEVNSFGLSLYDLEGVAYFGKTNQELAEYAPFYRDVFLSCVESDELAWNGGKLYRVEETVPKPDGKTLTFDVIKVPIFHEDGRRKGLVAVGRDITERKLVEEFNSYLAYHDTLTHLPNRRSFETSLNQSRIDSILKNEKLAILYLDIDRFKYINDTLGPHIGDQLLQGIAKSLKHIIQDKGSVFRLGGDEFAILVPHVPGFEEIAVMAQRIIHSISQPWFMDEYELYLTTSIGVSFCPHDGEDAETLMKNADTALYRAKEQGRNNYQIYTPSLSVQACKIFTLEKDLRKALEEEEFEIYYQPRVNARTGQIIGAEALIRWNHPELGLVSPADFIPLAEEIGLIHSIGKWVARVVCKQNKGWQQAGLLPIPISVNVSAKRFMQKDLVQNIKKLLEETGLAPHYLEIEITENSLMETDGIALSLLDQLKEMGVKVAIDDFGTGYSSLAYLSQFKAHSIKIDRSFIKGINKTKDSNNIISAIISLARNLEINVIAEGVETQEQLEFLINQKCNEIQGFLFSKPLPAHEFERLLEMGNYRI